jgi:hypothetical protein
MDDSLVLGFKIFKKTKTCWFQCQFQLFRLLVPYESTIISFMKHVGYGFKIGSISNPHLG